MNNKQLLTAGLKGAAGRPQTTTIVANTGRGDRQVEVSYTDLKVVGNGSFGVVFLARLVDTNESVAIKKVLQDKRFKNRELQIMRKLDHRNIVQLKYYFYSGGEKKDELYLNLILEFVPETVYRVARHYAKQRQMIPILYVKLYMYQLFRALAYIHAIGICHRDIKPQNLLIDPESGVLKLCDFGSAKYLVRGEPNVSYICSRYYRAPELIFGATNYTNSIDMWSAGTVMAELLLSQPIFPGDSGVDQLVEIIKVLGTPTREQIQHMNPNYKEFKFPQIKAHPWVKVFRPSTPAEAIDLISQIIEYTPSARPSPMQACSHAFFAELFQPSTRMPNNRSLPPLETGPVDARTAEQKDADSASGSTSEQPAGGSSSAADGGASSSAGTAVAGSSGSGAGSGGGGGGGGSGGPTSSTDRNSATTTTGAQSYAAVASGTSADDGAVGSTATAGGGSSSTLLVAGVGSTAPVGLAVAQPDSPMQP